MKNRAKLLCLKHNILYVEDYAEKIGVSTEMAKLILEEKVVIPQEVILRNCEVFNVSVEYFLCLV